MSSCASLTFMAVAPVYLLEVPSKSEDADMTQVLNYHDAVVYDTDVTLFDEHGWLNDNCINWFFRFLEFEVFQGRDDVLFMDPAVVSCMMHQCDVRKSIINFDGDFGHGILEQEITFQLEKQPDEFLDLAKGILLDSRKMVFVPVNDASGPLARGTHWSLLVFERQGEDEKSSAATFRHYDSSVGHNQTPAERTAEQFIRMFDGAGGGDSARVNVEHVADAPQQQNGYDCGMYTVLLVEHLASAAVQNVPPVNFDDPDSKDNRSTESLPPQRTSTNATKTPHSKMDDSNSKSSSQGSTQEAGERKCSRGHDVDVQRFGSLSPEVVSNARNTAKERLVKCIRDA